MKEELCVAHSMISFDNIGDLLGELDHSLDVYSKVTKRYEDRLGLLLRQSNDSSDPGTWSTFAEQALSGQGESDQQLNKKKKEDKKRDLEEGGWIALTAGDITIRLANGPETQLVSNEISTLFRIIETLKSKIIALESSRKLISELTSQGFKSDQKLKVVFKDGLPRYLIPSMESSAKQQKRFKYGEQFRLAVLK